MKWAAIFLSIALTLVVTTPHASARTVIKGKFLKTVTVTGYLSDVFCAGRPKSLDLHDLKKEPEKHTVYDMLLAPCQGSGYGVMVNMGTADFKNYVLKYKFDPKGNALAIKYLKGLKKKDNVLVTVTGKDDKGTLVGITIKDGK